MNRVFLLCVKGLEEEKLNIYNLCKLETKLRFVFGKNMMIVSSLTELTDHPECLIPSFFSSEPLSPAAASSISFSRDFSPCPVHMSSLSMVHHFCLPVVNESSPISVNDEDLHYQPSISNDSELFNKISSSLQTHSLTTALSTSLFHPSLMDSSSLSTTGSVIHLPSYIRYLSSPTSSPKVFKMITYGTQSTIGCSIVIDCSVLAFGSVNAQHSLHTVFALLQAISHLDIPFVDVWIANQSVIPIITGASPSDVWSDDVVNALWGYLNQPCHMTAFPETLQKACAVCDHRNTPSVLFALTNGVSLPSSREFVQSVVSTTSVSVVGMGLGFVLGSIDSLFTRMIWNANPLHLAETIRAISIPNKTEPWIKPSISILNYSFDSVNAEVVDSINQPCYYEVQVPMKEEEEEENEEEDEYSHSETLVSKETEMKKSSCCDYFKAFCSSSLIRKKQFNETTMPEAAGSIDSASLLALYKDNDPSFEHLSIKTLLPVIYTKSNGFSLLF